MAKKFFFISSSSFLFLSFCSFPLLLLFLLLILLLLLLRLFRLPFTTFLSFCSPTSTYSSSGYLDYFTIVFFAFNGTAILIVSKSQFGCSFLLAPYKFSIRYISGQDNFESLNRHEWTANSACIRFCKRDVWDKYKKFKLDLKRFKNYDRYLTSHNVILCKL